MASPLGQPNTPDGFGEGGNFYAEGSPLKITITPGTLGGGVYPVDITVRHGDNRPINTPVTLHGYLSDDSTGKGFAATAATGGIALGTGSGAVDEIIAGKYFHLSTDSTGAINIDVTDAGSPAFYMVVEDPLARPKVSTILQF